MKNLNFRKRIKYNFYNSFIFDDCWVILFPYHPPTHNPNSTYAQHIAHRMQWLRLKVRHPSHRDNTAAIPLTATIPLPSLSPRQYRCHPSHRDNTAAIPLTATIPLPSLSPRQYRCHPSHRDNTAAIPLTATIPLPSFSPRQYRCHSSHCNNTAAILLTATIPLPHIFL